MLLAKIPLHSFLVFVSYYTPFIQNFILLTIILFSNWLYNMNLFSHIISYHIPKNNNYNKILTHCWDILLMGRHNITGGVISGFIFSNLNSNKTHKNKATHKKVGGLYYCTLICSIFVMSSFICSMSFVSAVAVLPLI